MAFDRTKTLQELDGQDWGAPNFQSYVVVNSHRLRHVPLQDFTVEDLRLTVGQTSVFRDALPYLVPLALEQLEVSPVASGDFYEGDLLGNVGGVPDDFWNAHPDLKARFDRVAALTIPLLARLEAELEADYTARGGYADAPAETRSA